MIERMLRRNKLDLQIFWASISYLWLLLGCMLRTNNFVSTAYPYLTDAIGNFIDGVSHVFGGDRSVGELKSLVRIHNRVIWIYLQWSVSVNCRCLPYATGIGVEKCTDFIGFGPWGDSSCQFSVSVSKSNRITPV